ncbi:MAG: hypothetical protein AAGL68_05410, partial [Pseudomonadota bacterium]
MLGCLALGGAFVSTNASARAISMAVQPFAASIAVDTFCSAKPTTSIIAQQARPTSVRAAKSNAILGNEMSALELMRAQQAGAGATEVAASTKALPIDTLAPASNGVRTMTRPMNQGCPANIAEFTGGNLASSMIEISAQPELTYSADIQSPALKTLGSDD